MFLKKRAQIHESLTVAIFLTLAGGFQDSYSYIARGGVFANAQTGNIVLLSTNLFSADTDKIIKYLIPILSFVIGVYISVRVEEKFSNRRFIIWRQVILLIEIIIFIFVGFLNEELNNIANALLSFSCAMQVNTFRKVENLPFATTMCIGNMRSGTEMMGRYHLTKDKSYRRKALYYYLIIFIFAIGAFIGYISVRLFNLKSIWLGMIFLIIAFILLFLDEDL